MNLYKALPYCLLLSVFAGPVSGATPKRQDDPRGEDPEIRRIAIAALGRRDGAVVVVDPARGRILAAVNQQIAFSEGFQTTTLPAARAGIIPSKLRFSGKFHGVMQATTPRGTR